MGLIPVADGQIATVVTSLEMREKPRPRPLPPSPLRLARWRSPTNDKYRTLFRRVGEPWLWFSRLVLPDEALRGILDDARVEIYAATHRAGIELGMLELDFRMEAGCELSYLALVPEMVGQGHGGWLMAQALQLAWRNGVERVRVHTCTLDHPRALGFYRHHGFVPVRRTVETFADPRLAGILAADAAPHIPLLGTVAAR
ncbi:GNAT family N-acetyltransferase [Sphingomonas xinjiangensis]|uniref:GNAT superfamily N-acetyltransferase n=1 Tax=Sphingomonas xinjiangensis TaxID=643568 RepID=A0A840YPU5_9SPHN|nr:GNAT family N-acetyltransferase [Sphingomonas xinjiangensis]MBB5710122.1 GNAT superfamily N-acetyltransferase [Sphingomonas xinjiangensis]